VARSPRRGLLGRLLAALRGRPSPAGGESPAAEEPREVERRIEDARKRLKTTIPPRED
jgi:hypothetical protein